MNPFRFVARVFIDVFGITHPTEQQEKRAAWFICSLVALVTAGIVVLCLTIYGLSQH